MKNDVKTQLLSRVDYIAEYKAIGVRFQSETPNAGGWCECYSIDRDEQNPSAAINLENGFYVDLGNCDRRLDFFAMMQIYGGCSDFRSVLVKYCEKYGIALPKGRPQRSPETEVSFQKWSGIPDRWCAMKSTTPEAVTLFGGEYCRYKSEHFCIGFKVFSDPMDLENPAGYVVAQTNGAPIPVLDRNGAISGQCKIKTVSGTGSGLLGEHALATIREARENGTLDSIVAVFKVEGVTDALALQARIPVDQRDKILVVTNSAGCAEKPKEAYSDAFEGLPVVLIHDQDEPGQKGLESWKAFLAGKAGKLKVVNLPFPLEKNHGKDLKDFFTEGHSFGELMKLVSDAKLVELDTTAAAISSEYDDSPHRIAREFLTRRYAIPGVSDFYRILHMNGTWYTFQDGFYKIVQDAMIMAELTNFCEELFDEDYVRNLESWKHSGEGTAPKKMRVKTTVLNDARNALRAKVITQKDEMFFQRYGDPILGLKRDNVITYRNGTLFVDAYLAETRRPYEERDRSHYFRPADPAIFTLTAFEFDFDETARCDEWEKMNRENLMEQTPNGLNFSKYMVLQEFVGYAMLQTSFLQCFLLLTGEGANGKSAFLSGLCACFGSQNISNISLENFSERFAMADFYAKRLNIVDDLSEVDRTAEGLLKSVVSGSMISADRKNKDLLRFSPTIKLIFACNVEPRFQDTTEGLWRRMMKIVFERCIPEDQRKKEYCQIDFWKQFAAGIANWGLNGLLRLMDQEWKFTKCESIERAKIQYKYEINPILQFFDEFLVESPGKEVSSEDVYKTYAKWADENGFKKKNATNFAKDLYRKFKTVRKYRSRQGYKRYYVYSNLKFNPDIKSEF